RLVVDDLGEQRVGQRGAQHAVDLFHQVLAGPPAALLPGGAAEQRDHLPGEQVGDERVGVGPAAVDGGAAHPGPACHVGEGGAADAEGLDAGACRVEDLVFNVTS